MNEASGSVKRFQKKTDKGGAENNDNALKQ